MLSHEPSMDLSLFEVKGLLGNQVQTLLAVLKQIKAGVKDITVWGISGSGKSELANRLEGAAGIQVEHEWESRQPAKKAAVTVRFKTGIPISAGSEPLRGQLFHKGFGASALRAAYQKEKRLCGSPMFKTDTQVEEIGDQLAKCGLGSTTYLSQLAALPEKCGVAEKVAKIFVRACVAAQNSDFAQTFESLSSPEECKSSPLYFEVLKRLKKIEPGDVRSIVIERTLPVEVCRSIEQIVFGKASSSAAAEETLRFYESVDSLVGSVDEPAFLIRSGRPLSTIEEKTLCAELLPVFPILRLAAFSIWEHPNGACIDGDAPRKTGLYRFAGRDVSVFDGQVYITAERDLEPLIASSSPSRAVMPRLFWRNNAVVPKGTLIFGGGDHVLAQGHAALSLAVELVLQKLNISYEASRGLGKDPSCNFDFDGQTIRSCGSLTVSRD